MVVGFLLIGLPKKKTLRLYLYTLHQAAVLVGHSYGDDNHFVQTHAYMHLQHAYTYTTA